MSSSICRKCQDELELLGSRSFGHSAGLRDQFQTEDGPLGSWLLYAQVRCAAPDTHSGHRRLLFELYCAPSTADVESIAIGLSPRALAVRPRRINWMSCGVKRSGVDIISA